jgi:pimeloyl-ACP methyl ester carboxylesterase
MNMPASETMQVGFRTVDGLTIRYAESDGPRDQSILLTNPWPESLYAFEPIWQRLSQHAHLVAVDLPGFGRSERRDDLLSPQAMGEFLVRLIDAWGLDTPHLAGPDIGTGAALFAAALHPGKLRSLVIGSGGAAFPLQVTGALKDFIDAPDLERFRALDPRSIVGGAVDSMERYRVPGEIREDYIQSYEGDRFVESMKYVRSYPHDLPILRDLLGEIQTPVQIITGRRDALVPPVNAEFLHERLPHSKLNILDAGHLVWEEAADEYAAIVSAWVTGGYQNNAA